MIDFNQTLKNFKGDPLKDGNDTDFRLGDACVTALLSPDEKADGTQKLARFLLAQKIAGEGDSYKEIELTSKKKALLLDLCAKMFTPLVYGRVYEILEGTSEDDDE